MLSVPETARLSEFGGKEEIRQQLGLWIPLTYTQCVSHCSFPALALHLRNSLEDVLQCWGAHSAGCSVLTALVLFLLLAVTQRLERIKEPKNLAR